MSFQTHLLNPLLRGGKWLAAHSGTDTACKLNRASLKLLGAIRRPPLGYHHRSVSLGGVACEWVWKGHLAPSAGVIVLLHGGGFVSGSAASHREIAWRLCRHGDLPVLSINYRLAPEFVYPAQIDDVMSVYVALVDLGFSHIGLAGDSAGGNLALATTAECQRRSLQLPDAILCFSPWADLTHSSKSILENRKSESVIAISQLDPMAARYRGTMEAADPRVSPLLGSFKGFPPMQLHAMADEALLDDTLRLAESARSAGVSVDCHVWNNAPHAAPLFADVLPEGRKILRMSGEFFQRHLVGAVS